MDKAKIFIASSKKMLRCAETLRDELNSTGYCEARTWEEAFGTAGTLIKIGALEQWTKDYEFAVIIFAQADMLANGSHENLKTRDDCIFEAGLFMASIGRNRCFFVSSEKDEEKLPSDFKGINRLEFTEPSDLMDFNQCRTAMRIPAGNMKIQIQQAMAGLIPNRPLSRAALLNKQRKVKAGELQEDQVVISSVQPLELGDEASYETARRVRENIDNNISYIYFFEGNTDATDKIPHLLQLVLLAPFLTPNNVSFKSRGELVKTHRDEIVEALKDICNGDRVNIFFRRAPSFDLQYCIHNAGSDKVARLYLKHGDEYIEWDSGSPAYQFSIAVRRKNGVDDQKVAKAVFHAAPDFELEGPFLTNMEMGMRKYFGILGEEVMKLCLEGPQ